MPGFRFCSWCNGKGCICCDAEEKKFAEKALAKAPKWREPDIRDVRDAALLAETKRLESLIGTMIGSQEEFNTMEAEAHAEIEAKFKPELDAEYARQFPDGPTPMFAARLGNPGEMSILKQVFNATALQSAFGAGGRGMAEIEENLKKAKESA